MKKARTLLHPNELRNGSIEGATQIYPAQTALSLPMARPIRREFPEFPILCVGGVAIDPAGESVLLVRRAKDPLRGEWTIPGGMVELGEKLDAAVRREVREETGIQVRPLRFLALFERIVRVAAGVRFHYVVVDYLCRVKGGSLCPSSDAADARWVLKRDLAKYRLHSRARKVIGEAFAAVQS